MLSCLVLSAQTVISDAYTPRSGGLAPHTYRSLGLPEASPVGP